MSEDKDGKKIQSLNHNIPIYKSYPAILRMALRGASPLHVGKEFAPEVRSRRHLCRLFDLILLQLGSAGPFTIKLLVMIGSVVDRSTPLGPFQHPC